MNPVAAIANLTFNLFMIFVLALSGTALFALLRFGQSRLVGILTALFYITLVSSLYFQALTAINRL